MADREHLIVTKLTVEDIEAENFRLKNSSWEDLRVPATGISVGGFISAPTKQTNTGFLLFNDAALNAVGILIQMPHAWKVGSAIRPHVHWAKTTDAPGDVTWTMNYSWWGLGEVQPAGSAAADAVPINDPLSTQKQVISNFPEIDGTGKDISYLIFVNLLRNGVDASDTYAGPAVLYEFDIHYQIDSFGSNEEFTKGS